jgi:hypothetical protein
VGRFELALKVHQVAGHAEAEDKDHKRDKAP